MHLTTTTERTSCQQCDRDLRPGEECYAVECDDGDGRPTGFAPLCLECAHPTVGPEWGDWAPSLKELNFYSGI